MKIDITAPADPDIFRDRKKYALWFAFFLATACSGVAFGAFEIYVAARHYSFLDDWILGLLVGSSLGVTWFGNKLQRYKKLYPPHREKLARLKEDHPAINRYCAEVEKTGRRLIRAEYEACVDYAKKHSAVPFT